MQIRRTERRGNGGGVDRCARSRKCSGKKIPAQSPEDDIYVKTYVGIHTVLIQTVALLCIGWCSLVYLFVTCAHA
jgi:hypothetical protein